MLNFGGVSQRQMSRHESTEEDENHSCQDEELVINTLVTEPELMDIPKEDVDRVNDSYEDLANRVKRQY